MARRIAALCLLVCAACGSGGSSRGQPGSVPLDGSIDAAPVVAVTALGQVDRAGRPLVNLLLVPPALKDSYNAEGTFDAPVPTIVDDALQSRLEFLDTIVLGDGGPDPVDWPVPPGGAHPLLGMISSDALLVDPSMPSTNASGFVSSYLDIERELYLDGGAHASCGGRTPNDDVADTMLTLLVTGARGTAVHQGVQGPTKPASTSFPYLAPPN